MGQYESAWSPSASPARIGDSKDNSQGSRDHKRSHYVGLKGRILVQEIRSRRFSGAVRVSVAVLALSVGWQMAAFATCPPTWVCTPPPQCGVTKSAMWWCCATHDGQCCQYGCRNCTFTGEGCPGPAIEKTLIDQYYTLSCGGNGVCR